MAAKSADSNRVSPRTSPKSDTNKPVILRTWILWAFIRVSLIPSTILLIAFILIYSVTNGWSHDTSIRYMGKHVENQLTEMANLEAEKIEIALSSVDHTTDIYRLQTAQALATERAFLAEDRARLVYSPEGAFYTREDKSSGGAAVFYSGYSPINEAEQAKVARTLAVETLMKDIIATEPLAASLYFNSFDSLNVIYPYFDVISQYPPKMDIPAYNFYYEADAAHNPDRTVRWTDVYLDPAGHGWMASAIAPVYKGDFLEGVVGIDVTVGTITSDILDLNFPWDGYGLLLSKDGTILALPEAGEHDWNLDEITDHHYDEAIMQDTFKPADFNLFSRQDLGDFPGKVAETTAGTTTLLLEGDSKVAAWSTIGLTGWKLVIIVPQANALFEVNQMQKTLQQVGLYTVLAFILLNLILLAVITRFAQTTGRRIANPLQEINAIVRRIGEGQYDQTAPEISVKELSETAEAIVQMGHKLDEAMNSNAILQSANNLKSEFIANMSHEIRTPVNAILGYTSLLRESTEEPRQIKYIDTIQRAGTNLMAIINGILDLSKLEAGMIELQPEFFNLRHTLHEMQDIFTFECERKGIQLQFKIDPALPASIRLDELRIRQILINLIGNATKFTDQGTIEVAARYDVQQGQGSVQSGRRMGTLVLAVKDSGIGIPSSQLKKIFEPFRQKDGQSSRKYGGTGLGLTIVQRFVELMGGQIVVDSTVGQGSAFTITIPDVPDGHTSDITPLTEDLVAAKSTTNASAESDSAVTRGKSANKQQLANPQLYQPLTAILTGIWQECQNSGRINDFKALAAELQHLQASISDPVLAAYLDELNDAIEAFDIQMIHKVIDRFPRLVESAAQS